MWVGNKFCLCLHGVVSRVSPGNEVDAYIMVEGF